MCVVGRNILLAGITGKVRALRELPIRVLSMDTGARAILCLKEERIDTVISHWDLVDLPPGKLLRDVIEAKPSVSTIAFIKQGNIDQEIAARRVGVDAVLSEVIDDDYFRDTVCQLLGISTVAFIQSACMPRSAVPVEGFTNQVELEIVPFGELNNAGHKNIISASSLKGDNWAP